jgi:exo-beta-1,3-glucanase (GH17 family)
MLYVAGGIRRRGRVDGRRELKVSMAAERRATAVLFMTAVARDGRSRPTPEHHQRRWTMTLAMLACIALMTSCASTTVAAGPTKPFYGLCYGPFRVGQSPDLGIHPGSSEIADDLTHLLPLTDRIRLYSSTRSGRDAAERASSLGFREILAGIWLGRDPKANEREISAALDLARRRLRGVTMLVVGNEVLLRRDLAPQSLLELIRRVKREGRLPVAYADAAPIWIEGPPEVDEMAREVDLILVHVYPFWEGVAVGDAPARYEEILARIRARHPGKPIAVDETGWPAEGEAVGAAEPSLANQTAWVEFIRSRATRDHTFYFEAFSEDWKASHEGRRGATWGLFTSTGTPRASLVAACRASEAPTPQSFDRQPRAPADADPSRFYVYRDDGDAVNHGIWKGWMPEAAGDMLKLDLADRTTRAHGSTAVRVDVTFAPPNWCGVAVVSDDPWAWGKMPTRAFDLSQARRLVFWARGQRGGEYIQVKVGMTGGAPHGDSAPAPIATPWIKLTTDWRRYELGLDGAVLSRVVTPFVFVVDRAHNPGNQLAFFLDEIYVETGGQTVGSPTTPAESAPDAH